MKNDNDKEMTTILDGRHLVLGACYYPEQWPESMWREDLLRMLETGIEVIRIAEFAWSKTEPEEGVFTYDFFDSFLNLCDEVGMKVIFCTPTATPPAWLTEKYPEVLNADINGQLYCHGARRHYNYNSLVYRAFTQRIVARLGEHYGQRKCIIGWQIDNELNCEKDEFYSKADDEAFRLFLRDQYGTLDALNETWGTVFWNQTYTAWNEVHVPRKTIGSVNPHEMTDYIRFVSHSARSFCKLQSDILRKYIKPGDFITTNGLFGNLDNHQMTEESLDFLTYDSYPNFAYTLDGYSSDDNNLRDRRWSRNLMEVRSASSVFGIMEQQAGANGWNSAMEAPTPRQGQITLWTMQSIAHGADFVSYFRWRTAIMGTEMYWHGILDYSGRENRRIAEIRNINTLLQKLRPVAGTRYKAEAALIKDYDNVWDVKVDKWHSHVAWQSEEAIFTAAQRTHTPLDYVYLDHTNLDVLKQYKVLFYTHPSIMTRERAELLTQYVQTGGILVFGCRSAYKTLTGQCVTDKLPGLISELTAADVPEYSFIAPDAENVLIDWDGDTLEAAVFTDIVEPLPGGVREGIYTTDYYADRGALVSHKVGKGTAYYYGTAFTESAARIFLTKLGAANPWKDVLSLPESCELAIRCNENINYIFVLNYMKVAADICIKRPVEDVFTGEMLEGECTLPAYGVRVLKLTKIKKDNQV